jgi:hypothetical protein
MWKLRQQIFPVATDHNVTRAEEWHQIKVSMQMNQRLLRKSAAPLAPKLWN